MLVILKFLLRKVFQENCLMFENKIKKLFDWAFRNLLLEVKKKGPGFNHLSKDYPSNYPNL